MTTVKVRGVTTTAFALGIMALLGFSLIGCGQQGAVPVDAPATPAAPTVAPESRMQTGADVKVPEEFPAALVYPGAVHERAVTSPNENHVVSTSADDAMKVVDFYRRGIPGAGFKLESTVTPDTATTILIGSKGEQEFSATVRSGSPTRIELALKQRDEM